MTYQEKMDIIRGEGFTEYQAKTIYDEMGIANMDNEGDIIDAAMEWYHDEQLMERCQG